MAKTQDLTYSLRLPDAAQEDALRLLDASREVVNQTIRTLWPFLDAFNDRTVPQAWKQVGELTVSPTPHGNRQWRCESESAGRLLRAHAERKRLFLAVLPILSDGLIIPATTKKTARKDRKVLMQQVRDIAQGENATVMELVNITEQACNMYLKTGAFPATYEELQPIAVQHIATLTYAADDGMAAGQAYRMRIDLETATLTYRLRGPDSHGTWDWRADEIVLGMPAPLRDLLQQGAPMAPTLREIRALGATRYAVLDVMVEVPAIPAPAWDAQDRVLGWDWGVRALLTTAVVTTNGEQMNRPFFLNTGGFDGSQARLRRQIDQLKACRDRVNHLIAQCPDSPHRWAWDHEQQRHEVLIARCWRKYERRNKELAHLAANILIFLAQIHGCSLICGEQLSSLRTLDRGHTVRGRWRNWRNNTTIRSALQRVLAYKGNRWGIRVRQEQPKNTSHTCPRCGESAQTYAHSSLTVVHAPLLSGKWLICHNPTCGWNGARDYAAAINIARLGVAYLVHMQTTKTSHAYTMTSAEVKPVSYSVTGASLRLRMQSFIARPRQSKKNLAYSGWTASVGLRSSHPGHLLALLSSAMVRKQVLLGA